MQKAEVIAKAQELEIQRKKYIEENENSKQEMREKEIELKMNMKRRQFEQAKLAAEQADIDRKNAEIIELQKRLNQKNT